MHLDTKRRAILLVWWSSTGDECLATEIVHPPSESVLFAFVIINCLCLRWTFAYLIVPIGGFHNECIKPLTHFTGTKSGSGHGLERIVRGLPSSLSSNNICGFH